MTFDDSTLRDEIDILRKEISELESRLNTKRQQLDTLVSRCSHKWGKTVSDFIHTEGYTCPGDPVGTMGVDWRGPVYVHPTTTKRWKRTCSVCGEVQYTGNVVQTVTETPKFDV